MPTTSETALCSFALDYSSATLGSSMAIHADTLDWLQRIPEKRISGIVTDPPYGLEEFRDETTQETHNGNKGGIWRIPPSFDGHTRSPLPRFTALNNKQRDALASFLLNVAATRSHSKAWRTTFLSLAMLSFLFGLVVYHDGRLEFRGDLSDWYARCAAVISQRRRGRVSRSLLYASRLLRAVGNISRSDGWE
jgi:site-specific DNA-methyltransferase (adenine-specific)